MPDLQELATKYHLQPDVAFFLTLPVLSHMISMKFDELKKAAGVGAVAKAVDVNKVQSL
jgi:hypothetical protein